MDPGLEILFNDEQQAGIYLYVFVNNSLLTISNVSCTERSTGLSKVTPWGHRWLEFGETFHTNDVKLPLSCKNIRDKSDNSFTL